MKFIIFYSNLDVIPNISRQCYVQIVISRYALHLYKRVCRSVGQLVRRYIGLLVTLS